MYGSRPKAAKSCATGTTCLNARRRRLRPRASSISSSGMDYHGLASRERCAKYNPTMYRSAIARYMVESIDLEEHRLPARGRVVDRFQDLGDDAGLFRQDDRVGVVHDGFDPKVGPTVALLGRSDVSGIVHRGGFVPLKQAQRLSATISVRLGSVRTNRREPSHARNLHGVIGISL